MVGVRVPLHAFAAGPFPHKSGRTPRKRKGQVIFRPGALWKGKDQPRINSL